MSYQTEPNMPKKRKAYSQQYTPMHSREDNCSVTHPPSTPKPQKRSHAAAVALSPQNVSSGILSDVTNKMMENPPKHNPLPTVNNYKLTPASTPNYATRPYQKSHVADVAIPNPPVASTPLPIVEEVKVPKKRGRKPGSKNQPKPQPQCTVKKIPLITSGNPDKFEVIQEIMSRCNIPKRQFKTVQNMLGPPATINVLAGFTNIKDKYHQNVSFTKEGEPTLNAMNLFQNWIPVNFVVQAPPSSANVEKCKPIPIKPITPKAPVETMPTKNTTKVTKADKVSKITTIHKLAPKNGQPQNYNTFAQQLPRQPLLTHKNVMAKLWPADMTEESFNSIPNQTQANKYVNKRTLAQAELNKINCGRADSPILTNAPTSVTWSKSAVLEYDGLGIPTPTTYNIKDSLDDMAMQKSQSLDIALEEGEILDDDDNDNNVNDVTITDVQNYHSSNTNIDVENNGIVGIAGGACGDGEEHYEYKKHAKKMKLSKDCKIKKSKKSKKDKSQNEPNATAEAAAAQTSAYNSQQQVEEWINRNCLINKSQNICVN